MYELSTDRNLRIQQHLAEAASCLDEGDANGAAELAALAVELAFAPTANSIVGPIPSLPSVLLHTIADDGPGGGHLVAVDVGAIRDTLEQLRDTAVALAVGLRLAEFKAFRQLAPRLVAVDDDGSWEFEYPAEREYYTYEEAERLVRAAPTLVDKIERAAAGSEADGAPVS